MQDDRRCQRSYEDSSSGIRRDRIRLWPHGIWLRLPAEIYDRIGTGTCLICRAHGESCLLDKYSFEIKLWSEKDKFIGSRWLEKSKNPDQNSSAEVVKKLVTMRDTDKQDHVIVFTADFKEI